jgi:hypothetical protein
MEGLYKGIALSSPRHRLVHISVSRRWMATVGMASAWRWQRTAVEALASGVERHRVFPRPLELRAWKPILRGAQFQGGSRGLLEKRKLSHHQNFETEAHFGGCLEMLLPTSVSESRITLTWNCSTPTKKSRKLNATKLD